jgi:hypothetical protein
MFLLPHLITHVPALLLIIVVNTRKTVSSGTVFILSIIKSPLVRSILSQVSPIHSSYPISSRSIPVLSYHVCLTLPSGLFPPSLPNKTHCAALLLPIQATYPTHTQSSLKCAYCYCKYKAVTSQTEY